MLNVGELKKHLKELPDDCGVVGVGHFGEALDCQVVGRQSVRMRLTDNARTNCFVLDMEDAGEEPE